MVQDGPSWLKGWNDYGDMGSTRTVRDRRHVGIVGGGAGYGRRITGDGEIRTTGCRLPPSVCADRTGTGGTRIAGSPAGGDRRRTGCP